MVAHDESHLSAGPAELRSVRDLMRPLLSSFAVAEKFNCRRETARRSLAILNMLIIHVLVSLISLG